MKRLVRLVLLVDGVALAALILGGGRQAANTHPVIRHGRDDWY